MNKQKGSSIILLILIIAGILAFGGGAYYIFKDKQPTKAPDINRQNNQQNIQSSDSPKLIKCNPREFDSKYFTEKKPCISDMNDIDTERENKAISIIKGIKDHSFGDVYGNLARLLISDKRYQVMQINDAPSIMYAIVDLDKDKMTDSFYAPNIIEMSAKRFIFASGDVVSLYVTGTEKSKEIPGTALYSPQSYVYFDGPEGSTGIKIIATSTDFVTLGVYDKSKPLPKKAEDDFIKYKKVGEKNIDLSQPAIINNNPTTNIKVILPSDQNTFKSGDILTIKWNKSEIGAEEARIKLSLVVDAKDCGGKPCAPKEIGIIPNGEIYNWKIPGNLNGFYLVVISNLDGSRTGRSDRAIQIGYDDEIYSGN